MFDILPNILSSIITILFPIFASYKALRTADPAQLTPWLMYWVVLSCFSLFDYWTYFLLSWVPLYAWFRLGLLSYLVLPQTQGAKLLYGTYIHPFLAHHENDIDRMITTAHARAVSAGLEYLKQLVELVKRHVFGVQQLQQSSGKPPYAQSFEAGGGGGGNYAQNLLSRFNLPSARRQGFLAAPAGDLYGLLSAAVGNSNVGADASAGAASRDAQVESLSRSGTLIPQGMTSPAEKMSFLTAQREHLKVILGALDRQASDLGTEVAIQRDVDQRMAGGAQLGQGLSDGLKKSRSEAEFEEIGTDGPVTEQGTGKAAGGWMPWLWGGGAKVSGVDATTGKAS